MGANPKQRISHKHRHDRRSHDHIKPLHLVDCPQCHNPRLPHHVCPVCGTYRGRQVLQIKAEETPQS